MKNCFSLLLLCLSWGIPIFAQFSPQHYLITTNQDTLKGLIADKGWTTEPEWVHIRLGNDTTGTIQTIPAAEIQAFSTGSVQFVRKKTKVLKPVNEIRLLTTSPEATFSAVAPHLLRVLVAGKLSLLYLKNESGEHLFVAKGDSLSELYSLEYMALDKELQTQKIATFSQYKKVLSAYIIDCPQLIYRIADLSLTQKSITALVHDYNSICAEGVVFEEVVPKSRLFLSGFAGAGVGMVGFRSSLNNWYYLTAVNGKSREPMIQAGLRLQLAPPGRGNRWRFQAEAFFTNSLATFDGQFSSPGFLERTYSSRIQVNSLAANLGVCYYHPSRGAIRPYGALSVNMLFNDYSANRYSVTDTYTGSAPKTTTDVAIIYLNNKNMGPQITIGAIHKNHIFTELRYLNTTGPSGLVNLWSRRQSLALVLGYQL